MPVQLDLSLGQHGLPRALNVSGVLSGFGIWPVHVPAEAARPVVQTGAGCRAKGWLANMPGRRRVRNSVDAVQKSDRAEWILGGRRGSHYFS